MFIGDDLKVFSKYRDSGAHAFSNNIVSEEDKDRYANIHSSIIDTAHLVVDGFGKPDCYKVWGSRFGRDGGVQGQRPVDLWVSVINKGSEPFGRYPQVYMIATDEGIEIGFSVAIHEGDYYNAEIKLRNRSIVPILYSKLPSADSPMIVDLNNELSRDGHWLFGMKSRQASKQDFSSLGDLIAFLKSSESSEKGGGSIYRLIKSEEIDQAGFDLGAAFEVALNLFTPLMRILTPTGGEAVRLKIQNDLIEEAEKVVEFNPSSIEDGRKKTVREVAVRQGQAKFREKLITAYGGCCAISGVTLPAVLQAAHIFPYQGKETNHVANGILLRADIHNLFDLGFIQVDPEKYTISVSDELMGTEYERLDGRSLKLPKHQNQRPSKMALEERLKLFSGG